MSMSLSKVLFSLFSAEIEKLGEKPLKKFLCDINWPVTVPNKSWEEITRYGRNNGLLSSTFVNIFIDVDLTNSTQYVLYIDQADSLLPQEIFLDGIDEPVVQTYLELIEWMIIRLSPDTKNYKQLAKEIVELEIELAKISDRKETRRDLTKTHSYMSISKLQETFQYLNWTQYLTDILGTKQFQLVKDKGVILGGKDYFKKFEGLLKKTHPQTLQNLATWSLIAEASSMLSKDFREQLYELEKTAYGIEREEDRWKECTNAVLAILPSVVGSMYIRKYFGNDSKVAVTKMTQNILSEFNQILKEVDWMDEKTRLAAFKKIENMDYFIGYANELLDDNLLEKYYKDISGIDINLPFFDLVLSVTNFTIDEMFNLLSESADRRDWRLLQTPATANAFYLASHNHIELAAGILQDELFSTKRPDFLNYATIGTVIGHEISHAFDDEGSQFDQNGNVLNWWEEEAHKNFYKKANCFVVQYSNYTEGDMHVNGVNTQGENVADHGGTSVAYRAYKKFARDKEFTLDGLNFTIDQLFWIAAAEMWCTNRRNGKF